MENSPSCKFVFDYFTIDFKQNNGVHNKHKCKFDNSTVYWKNI